MVNPLEFKDTIDISISRKNLSRANNVGVVAIDKGTAAHTNLYANRGSFKRMMIKF